MEIFHDPTKTDEFLRLVFDIRKEKDFFVFAIDKLVEVYKEWGFNEQVEGAKEGFLRLIEDNTKWGEITFSSSELGFGIEVLERSVGFISDDMEYWERVLNSIDELKELQDVLKDRLESMLPINMLPC